MKEVKTTTLERQMCEHDRSRARDLYDVYGTVSQAKINAMDYCKELMRANNGWDLKILSKNTFQFTVGFYFYNTEINKICFAYITKDYDRFCRLNDYNGYIPYHIKLVINEQTGRTF